MPRVTLFDPRHSFVPWEEAKELSDATGMKPEHLAVFRAERLALHSVLIRVTSQLFVPDGPNYADLGINLRTMAGRIYEAYVLPEIDAVEAAFEHVRKEARTEISKLLEEKIYGHREKSSDDNRGMFARVFGRVLDEKPLSDPSERALAMSTRWKEAHNEDIPSASRRALGRTIGAVLNKRGALHVDRDIIARVAEGVVLNRLGSAAVGRCVEEIFNRAVLAEGYHRLPPQKDPVVLNAKGASAAGKSSIRGDQHLIAERLGLDWKDFAIISPDDGRKSVRDYDGLGEDYKYAAMLTGQELEIIDRKLDILMAMKGQKGTVPHMLIDRFRFDSFQADRTRGTTSTLLTRFGAKVYLFFVITPPEATVERAWKRGLATGRYKAVDDLLYHNVEAYSGIPNLFFGWAQGRGKWVHYEFLDNSVAAGNKPRTIAFGKNGDLVITDLDRLCDITRFRFVNVDAKGPDEVLQKELSQSESMEFVKDAMKHLSKVEVTLLGSNQVFARSIAGKIEVDVNLLPKGIEASDFGDFQEAKESLGRVPEDVAANVIGG